MILSVPRNRIAEYPIDSLFLHRWSPRALNGENMPRQELMSLFEAARWAPSSGNGQPWRFLFALRDSGEWETFFNLLNPGNQAWAHRASALVLLVSQSVRENGKPNPTHRFDAGAAWMNFALQASLRGLVAHGMAGYDSQRAIEDLGLPPGYMPEILIAVGYPGRVEDLPEPQRAREVPSDRKSLSEMVFEGKWTG